MGAKTGGRGQYLLAPNELELLERLHELEQDYKGVESSVVQLRNERLQNRVNELESKNKQLNNELIATKNVAQRLRGTWLDRVKSKLNSVLSWFRS